MQTMTGDEDDTGESTQRMVGAAETGDNDKMRDPYYLTYILFYALGVLTLVPANFYTTATDFWMYKFRNTSLESFSLENRTGLQAKFISNYSIVTNVSNIVFLAFTIVVLCRRLSIVQRMVGSLTGIIVMFAITVVFVQVNTDSWQFMFFATSLIIGFVLTAFTAAFMVTVFELVSRFPPTYILAIMSGQAICGVFAALVQIFSLSIGASSTLNGLVYFLVGMFFIFLTLLCFLTTLKLSDFFKFYLNKEVTMERPTVTKKLFFAVLNKLKYLLFSMILILGSTIMINPGVTSLVVSVDKGNNKKWNDIFFVPVVTFLFYHLTDYIGRETAGKLKQPKNDVIIFVISLCRIALVPMLMLCNAQPRNHLPVVFDEDYVYIILIVVLGFTTGYFVNLCVIQVPLVTTEEEKHIAFAVILIFMIISLGACSFLSAVLVDAL